MLSSDILCLCGHKDSEHFCFDKLHEQPKHDCRKVKTFCAGPRNCLCQYYRMDNLSYLESLTNDQ